MDTSIIVEILKTLALSSPVGIITWFFTKRNMEKAQVKQAQASAEGTQADVIVKNLEIYQNMLDDVEKRYEVKLAQRDNEILYLETKIKELELRIRHLEK